MTIDTSREAVERVATEYRERVRMHDELTGACADLRRERTLDIRDLHEATADTLTALLAERDAALAEVARLSTPPDDVEVAELVERAREWWSSNQVGATDLLNTMADALTSQTHALAAERKLADDAKRLLELAEDRCGHNFVGAEYPTFVDFCDAHAARRKEETLAEHGSKT